MRVHFTDPALALALVAAACASPEKQLESDRRYMSISYSDTSTESFSRTNRAVTGALVDRLGDSVRFRIRTRSDSLVSGVDITLHPASERGERPVTRRIGMPQGTLPLMGNSVAFLEQLLRRARVVGGAVGDSVSIPVMLLGAQSSLEVFTVIRNGPDSVVLVGRDGDRNNGLHLAVDGQGRIVGGLIPISGTRIIALSDALAP